ncbi:hypothetical protein GQ600_7906 [Phytophthora cactorum]|nr:hypothetical protein GQ600_7906 [Phytophthora cactorum]
MTGPRVERQHAAASGGTGPAEPWPPDPGLGSGDTGFIDDQHLRSMHSLEGQALLAYLSGAIELRHPPNFQKAIMPAIQRAIIEDLHRSHVECSLVADGVKLDKRPAHIAILEEIFKANTEANFGAPMVSRLAKDVKRFSYDGRHTLTMVFYSKRLAMFWAGTTMRIQPATIELADATRNPSRLNLRAYSAAQLKQQYAVNILEAESISIVDVTLALTAIAGCGVLDVEAPRSEALGITTIRIPCYRCFSSRHTAGRCKVSPDRIEEVRRTLQRWFKGSVAHYTSDPASAYEHPDIFSINNSLATRQQQLKTTTVPGEIGIAPSLEPLSQPNRADAADNNGSTEAAKTDNGYMDMWTVGPTQNPIQANYWFSWFDGSEVFVPNNGQCAVLALYATVANHPSHKLILSSDVRREANRRKQAIYTLMITNLVEDVQRGLVRPMDELRRLYHDSRLPASTPVATPQLCTHWAHERMTSVEASTPSSYWQGHTNCAHSPSICGYQWW